MMAEKSFFRSDFCIFSVFSVFVKRFKGIFMAFDWFFDDVASICLDNVLHFVNKQSFSDFENFISSKFLDFQSSACFCRFFMISVTFSGDFCEYFSKLSDKILFSNNFCCKFIFSKSNSSV